MSKSKKESLRKADNQLEKDVKKFQVIFDSFTDDEKILYNRLHRYDKLNFAANIAISFAMDTYSFDKETTTKEYNKWTAKMEKEAKEAEKLAAEEIKKEEVDKDILEVVPNGES